MEVWLETTTLHHPLQTSRDLTPLEGDCKSFFFFCPLVTVQTWQGVSLIYSVESIAYVYFVHVCVMAAYQALRCVPMTWRRWPTRSQGVSKNRNPQTPPGRLFLKRRFQSQGTKAAN